MTLHTPHDLLDAVGELPQSPDGLVVEATDVHKYFGRLHVLQGVNLTVRRREVVVIIGPSGSGKTTFLRCINHLERIQEGRISVNGQLIGYREESGKLVEDKERNIAAQRAQIGFVFQRFNLFPHLTALDDNELTRLRREHVGFIFQFFNLLPMLNARENIVLPLTIAGEKVEQDWLDSIVEEVGLQDRLTHRPSELSGGQQQRVAIARALVSRPTVLFADEPTGNLDSTTGAEILELIRLSVQEQGQTVVMVTHDPRAAAIADRILFLADGTIVRESAGSSAHEIVAAMEEIGAA